MLKIFNSNYYIDLNAAIEVCRPLYTNKQTAQSEKSLSLTEAGNNPEDDPNGGEINIFKFEIVKSCIERTFGEYSSPDEDVVIFAENELSPSFKLAFNTLEKYKILKTENE